MDKLTIDYQKKFEGKLIYDPEVLKRIDPRVKLHEETESHPMSSSASCLNVLGSMGENPEDLKEFLNSFGLKIDRLIEFPYGAKVKGSGYEDCLDYNDRGYVVFEWIGPKRSLINEGSKGGRGNMRTSIDAFVLAKIEGKITQVLIEWKFIEGIFRPMKNFVFSGLRGVERLRRYSGILQRLRKKKSFPYNFSQEGGIGISDFGVDHLYQLLRMTLLAKMTTPIKIGEIPVSDYRIVHLTHSENQELKTLQDHHLVQSPGLKSFSGEKLHDFWRGILVESEKEKFTGTHWDKAIARIKDDNLKRYLNERYVIS